MIVFTTWNEIMWGAFILLLTFAFLVIFLFPKRESKDSYTRLWVIAMLVEVFGFVIWFLIYFSLFL